MCFARSEMGSQTSSGDAFLGTAVAAEAYSSIAKATAAAVKDSCLYSD
jgi:hypothetical protein